MSIDEIGPEALKLPLRDRAMLAASLWESIEDPFELGLSLSDDDAIDLALQRDAELDSGKVQALGHTELMDRLRQ